MGFKEQTYECAGGLGLLRGAAAIGKAPRRSRVRAAAISGLLGGNTRAMLSQTLLDLFGSLDLDLLRGSLRVLARWRVTSGGVSVGLSLVEVLDNALVVLLNYLLGNALHTKNLNVETLTVRQSILNVR